ncbi:MAG: O-antigen ligase family protein [Candidatus Levybacteria bacterium]|nr:O-antigen ligase family protein [Candidatus Levybacteria bacterium]
MSTTTTFFGNEFRLQGVFLLWMLLAWAVLSSRIQLDKILHPLFIFGCLFAELLFALLIDGEGATRAIGTIGEPNALAAAVLFIWPFLYFTKKKVPSWMKYGALAMVFLIIFISGSRSGMIAFMLQLIFLLLSRTSLATAKSVLISVLLLLFTYGLPFLPQSNLYEQRSEIWHAAVIAGGDSPVVGNGFGNTDGVLQDVVNSLNTNLRGSYIDSSHNIFLDWWVQGGMIGLIAFVFLIGRTLFNFIKEKNVQNLILLLGLIATLSFNPASVVALIALWWLIGQGLIGDGQKEK